MLFTPKTLLCDRISFECKNIYSVMLIFKNDLTNIIKLNGPFIKLAIITVEQYGQTHIPNVHHHSD